MPKRSVSIVFSLFIMLGMACSLSSNPAVTQNAPASPIPPLTTSNPTPTEAPRLVTEASLELLNNEGTSSANEWTANIGCVPKRVDESVALVRTPDPQSKDESHLKVAPDGTLEGTCYEEREDGTSSGTLTGKIDWASGTITYHLDAREETVYQGFTTVITMALDGTGAVTENDQATGDATWGAACRADSPDGATCSADEPGVLSLDVTGTVPWRMVFTRN